MTEEKKDFDAEVLGPALQERAEKGQQYISPPLDMQGKLFGVIAREIIDRFGDEGRDAVIRAVKEFGEERGRRMAERIRSEGREPTFANFLVFSDLDTSYHQMVPSLEEGAVRVTISYCPFAEACKEWGLEGSGKYFCQHIDAAIMRGYNPDKYETICEQNLTEGAETCVIVYKYREED